MNNYDGKNQILVTGGAGYIGSHTVVALVEAGYVPIIIDNFVNARKSVLDGIKAIVGHDVKVYEGDCGDEVFLKGVFEKETHIGGVIHFAAFKAVGESVASPLKYYQNNIGTLLTLLKVMRAVKVSPFVFSSSCTVYGQPDQLPVTEQTPKKLAESPYGNTKQICEEILEDVVKSKATIKAVALRYFNPIGAHSSSEIGELPLGVPANLIPFVTQTAAGIREKLMVFGNDYQTSDGTCVRDYIHVVDLAMAHVRALEYLDKQGEVSFFDIFNIGTGNGNSVLEVIKTFEKVYEGTLNYEIGSRRQGDIEKVYANVDKARLALGWKAELSLEDALLDAWNWQKRLH